MHMSMQLLVLVLENDIHRVFTVDVLQNCGIVKITVRSRWQYHNVNVFADMCFRILRIKYILI